MLKIRQVQKHLLADGLMNDFIKEMNKHLHKYYPQYITAIGDNAEQLQWVSNNIDQAKGFDITIEQDICRYLNIAISQGQSFYELAWATDILHCKLTGSTRVTMLEDAVSKQLVKEIKEEKRLLNTLVEEQCEQFCEKKLKKVVSTAVFFDIPVKNSAEAWDWLYEVTMKGLEQGANDDMLLDAYLDAAMRFGKDFEKQPWARDIFEQDDHIVSKMKHVMAYICGDA
ncbi:MAG: hypothetical protein HRU20_31085 [Pseudomonadales bacterium]|nr:hypothetical protein [Pseudomonadales bacterium]